MEELSFLCWDVPSEPVCHFLLLFHEADHLLLHWGLSFLSPATDPFDDELLDLRAGKLDPDILR